MTLAGKPFWASLPGGDGLVDEVKLRCRRYFEAADQMGLIEQWRQGDGAYFLRDHSNRGIRGNVAPKLNLGSPTDPQVRIKVPELRALLRQELAFMLAEPPGFQVIPTQGDTRSVMAGDVAEKAVNFVYEQHARESISEFAEWLMVFGLAATHLRWDAAKGDNVRVEAQVTDPETGGVVFDPQTGQPAMAAQIEKTGAPFVDALTPFDFAFDPKLGPKAGWCVAFEQTNLYALAAEYPQLAERILGQSVRDEFDQYRLNQWQDWLGANEGDAVAMHFYYADRPEMRGGRYALIVGDMVLMDVPQCPLANGRLPVRPAVTSKFADSAYGFAESWGLMGVEEAVNRIRSSSLTNIAYFGAQSIVQEEGTKTTRDQHSGDRRKVFTVPRGAAPVAPVPVLPMPAATKDVLDDLIKALARVTGFGDVSRGQIEKTTSGAHASVFEAITSRNMSLVASKIARHEEDLANDLIEMIMRYANTAFVAEMAGKEGTPIAKSFAPEDFSSIRRVRAKAVPEAMRGPLARLQVLEAVAGIEDEREKAKAIAMVVRGDDEYGKVEARQNNLIARENEVLITGEGPATTADTDDHYAHLRDHAAALAYYRTQEQQDAAAIERFSMHISEHVQSLMNQDPVMAQALGFPPPPILPGNPAFTFQQSLQQAQMMLNPPPPPAPPGEDGGQPGEDMPPEQPEAAQ